MNSEHLIWFTNDHSLMQSVSSRCQVKSSTTTKPNRITEQSTNRKKGTKFNSEEGKKTERGRMGEYQETSDIDDLLVGDDSEEEDVATGSNLLRYLDF